MDFLTVITYVAGVVETAALLGALVFVTRAMKAGKNSPERKGQVTKAMIFLGIYLALNILRTSGFGM